MTLWGIRVRLHLLTPLMLALAFALSGGQALASALVALCVHESAHLFAALRLRARVDEIELMPFGAAIRLYELWETSPGKLIAIALAGPGANLILASFLTLFLYASPRLSPALAPLIQMNLTIGLVNLIPALPLDGGRALCALLALRMNRHRAVKIGIWAGRILAAAMLAACGYMALARGRVELCLLLPAIYLIASGERERRQSEGATLRALLLSPAPANAPVEARVVSAPSEATAYETARAMQPGASHICAVLDENGALLGWLTQAQLSRALAENSAAPLSEVLIATKKEAAS